MSQARVLALLSVAALPGLSPAADSNVTVQAIDAVVTAGMKKQRLPGAAVAVVHKGKEVVVKGYGEANVEHHVPATADTIFQSGSVGKQFTAAAVLLLVEDGKLALDDPLTKFYPDAPWRWHRVTVRHLLTHTSGVPNYEGTGIDYRKDYTDDELAKFAFGLKLDFEPGARWRYSNTGYALLGFIVRKASGQFYGDILRDRVFGPLGMKSARVISEEDIVPHRAAGYRLVDDQLKNQEWVSPSFNKTADGSLYLSIRDMAAWDKGLRDRAVLKPESWAKAFAPVKLKSGKTYPYGFGWMVDDECGQPRQSHSGAWQGFTTHISRYLTDDLSVIVLTNLSGADPGDIAERIAALDNPKLAPTDAPIPDNDPAVTKRVRELLDQARDGKLSADQFAYDGEGYSADAAKAFQSALDSVGKPDDLKLYEARERGDERSFRYRATYPKKTIEVWLSLAPDGKLATFHLDEVKPGEK